MGRGGPSGSSVCIARTSASGIRLAVHQGRATGSQPQDLLLSSPPGPSSLVSSSRDPSGSPKRSTSVSLQRRGPPKAIILDGLSSLPTQMDYKGQKLAEQMFQGIILFSAVIGFIYGYVAEQFGWTVYIVMAGFAFSCLVRNTSLDPKHLIPVVNLLFLNFVALMEECEMKFGIIGHLQSSISIYCHMF
ncbi:signal peptidase complex subunit 1 isoform X1 [Monodelphis domestica]|uniref:signal peptidase complex subunit 1 isoform X1 n=1 Tax=Monodelphis domestica TaxID=13616 RepID=UPI0024E20F87|nr:signal peptidase complex subunit 1 isoform X1 [Monodelphis domestica]